MAKSKVEKLAEDIEKLPPTGKAIVGMVLDAKIKGDELVGSILQQEQAIKATSSLILTRKEMIDDHVQNKQTWLDLETGKEELRRLQLKHNQALANDADYNNMMEDMGELKDKKKAEEEVLSELLLGYFADTHERQIETGPRGDARTLVLKAKLGKEGKFQPSLFAQDSVEARLPYKDN